MERGRPPRTGLDGPIAVRLVQFGHLHVHSFFGWDTRPKLPFSDSERRVEVGSLHPVPPENLLRAGRARNPGPGRLDAPAQVAKPPLRGALVRLAAVVGQPARDLQEAEPPRRGRDLVRVLVFVRAAERDPRLEPRPRVVAEAGAGETTGVRAGRSDRLRA